MIASYPISWMVVAVAPLQPMLLAQPNVAGPYYEEDTMKRRESAIRRMRHTSREEEEDVKVELKARARGGRHRRAA